MHAYRTVKAIADDGTLELNQLPFPAGSVVEIIVLAVERQADPSAYQPLRDSVVRYDDPTEPVGLDDWDVLS